MARVLGVAVRDKDNYVAELRQYRDKKTGDVSSTPSDKDDYGSYMFVFDTGAAHTVMPSSFVINPNERRRHSLPFTLKAWLNGDLKKFNLIDGRTVIGERCIIGDVWFGELHIKNFYVYLVDCSTSLLGFDFISRCSISSSVMSDIVITEFDEEGYERSQLGVGAKFVNAISSSVKGVASALRKCLPDKPKE